PRPNEDVNKFFMCDYGRLNYRWMNRQDRAEKPMVRQSGVLAATDWETAMLAAADLLRGKSVHVVASPNLSNEALFLLSEMFDHNGGRGVFRVDTGDEAPLPGVEDLALRRDRAANVNGAELLGYTRSDSPLDGLADGDVLVIADDDLEGIPADALAAVSSVIVIGTTLPKSMGNPAVVLPITNFTEEEGTFTNLRGRVQRFTQAKAAPGQARPSWLVLGDLLGAMGAQEQFFLPSQVFANIAESKSEFAGLTYDTLGMRGLPVVQPEVAGSR
ncbi:MAG: molybdopterin-dependent oxidoreductase, partial [Gemmatimonadaceae bacterium]